MNERIEKLIDDAKLTAVSEMFEDDLARFAELIVRECIELNRQELSFSAFARMLDKYNDHFGIEK
jgi:hypothetical protein